MLRCYRFFCIEIRSDANFLPQAIVVVVLYTKHFEIVLFIVQFKKGVSFKMLHMYRRRMLSTRNKPFLWAKEKREKNQKHSNCATHMLMLRYVLQQQHSSKHSGRYNAGHPCHVRQVTTDSATRLVSSVAHTQKAPQLTTNKQHIHKHIYTIE